ncbi:MAG: UDP-N-acetylmuramate dehydrogenase [Acidobacteria bacterium]|nr:MAG: UDP-N-acetylmuramate dehydrogenase [Acidobacteriota bacterium]REK08699.1 MAG: UDP-N-acetylmuramate dehydrogenase [Acidobacteriota bacterium]
MSADRHLETSKPGASPSASASSPPSVDRWREWADAAGCGDRLELEADRSLAASTTLRIGGAAELYAGVHDVEALRWLASRCRELEIAVCTLGQGANVLVPDEGLAGVVQRLRGEFRRFEIDGDRVRAGAAVLVPQLAKQTVREGLLGLEPLGGFPASVGGAVTMNAGCYGTEISELIEEVVLLLPGGETLRQSASELEPGYRRTNVGRRGAVVIEATLRLRRGDAEHGARRLAELNEKRWSSLPAGKPSAGSIFKNPPGDSAGRLIEAVGLKGRREGGAAISDEHANVIVNLGGARAGDVLRLMIMARDAVLRSVGIRLQPEIVLLGGLREAWRAAEAEETNGTESRRREERATGGACT